MRGLLIIVASRTNPQLSVLVGSATMQVHGYVYLFFLRKRLQVYHANGVVVIRHHITTAIRHIQLVVNHCHFLWLITHRHLCHRLQCQRVYLVHLAQRSILTHTHWSNVRTDIGIAFVESHIATIRHVYFSYLHGITCSQHLHFVRTVDDQPQPRTVYLRIVAYIA